MSEIRKAVVFFSLLGAAVACIPLSWNIGGMEGVKCFAVLGVPQLILVAILSIHWYSHLWQPRQKQEEYPIYPKLEK